jgi:transcriptional regulator with XRE-family HTH domain
MHRFRNSLAQLIAQLGLTQQGFAKQLGTDPANVSRWLSGKSVPDSETIGRILECLPEQYRSDMLTAYLKDQIPNRFESLVKIEPLEGGKIRIEDEGPDLPPNLGPEPRKQIIYLAHMALRWQEVRKLLDVVYTMALKGRPARLRKGGDKFID